MSWQSNKYSNLRLELSDFDFEIELKIKWQYNDAGIKQTKFAGTNDCGVRAFALAHDMPYCKARDYLRAFTKIGRAGNRRISIGIYKEDMINAMESKCWLFNPIPKDITCNAWDLPKKGHFMLDMPRHFSTLIDGVIHDTWDCTDLEVLGYWYQL